MTSQAQALRPLAGVQGLAFLGFPLHPPEKPAITRAEHLSDVNIPMLFVQGTRDPFAAPDELTPVVERIGRATLRFIDEANHSFEVRGTKRPPAEVGGALAEIVADFMRAGVA